ncbi:unnamed protein product [Phaeothamnion confervicola]
MYGSMPGTGFSSAAGSDSGINGSFGGCSKNGADSRDNAFTPPASAAVTAAGAAAAAALERPRTAAQVLSGCEAVDAELAALLRRNEQTTAQIRREMRLVELETSVVAVSSSAARATFTNSGGGAIAAANAVGTANVAAAYIPATAAGGRTSAAVAAAGRTAGALPSSCYSNPSCWGEEEEDGNVFSDAKVMAATPAVSTALAAEAAAAAAGTSSPSPAPVTPPASAATAAAGKGNVVRPAGEEWKASLQQQQQWQYPTVPSVEELLRAWEESASAASSVAPAATEGDAAIEDGGTEAAAARRRKVAGVESGGSITFRAPGADALLLG